MSSYYRATRTCAPRRYIVVAIFAVLLLAVTDAAAQSQSAAEKAVQALSVRTQTTVKELSSLVSLPADDWRFHAGDIAHGESTDLDDSGWQTVKKGTQAPNDAVWYRRVIEVPKNLNGYDLTGARIWFQFQADANGPMPQIIYFNGRRVAMGDDLEPIVLFDDAKPGDKALVAVKLLHTVDQKTFAGANLRIDFSAARPNPSDLLQEIESMAVLTRSKWATSPAVKQQFDAAAESVDLNALKQADQQAFDVVLAEGAERARADEASIAGNGGSPDGECAHRRGVAVAVDRDGGRGAAHVRHGIAAYGRISAVHVHPIGSGL